MYVPIFLEVIRSEQYEDLRICHKIMRLLFQRKLHPLPFATSLDETVAAIHTLKANDLAPSIFIVNSLWAEETVRDLDAVTGDAPILLLQRSISMHDPLPLQDIGDRPFVCCRYGAKNSEAVALRIANVLERYVRDGEFRHIEAAVC